MGNTDNKEFDVIVIGGGATGTGTARDCALRGFKTLLVERDDLACGASGRNHGLLHSGARYAVGDPEGAMECIQENRILRHIAAHCVEPTGGLFISLPGDDPDYRGKFIQACTNCGIQTREMSPQEAMRLDPSINPALTGAVSVPDGSVDPFRLCAANALDAKRHGAEVRFHTEVKELIVENATVKGVKVLDKASGQEIEFYSKVVVNAAGVWGARILQMAGLQIRIYPAKGSLLVYGHRVNKLVLNRCRKPANADIIVPGDTVCILGTTSDKVPLEICDSLRPTAQEIDLLSQEGRLLCPELAHTRILRAYSGVRPLVGDDSDPTGRGLSRGIVCLDHAKRDGMEGLVTISGGKLMTYRLMAEEATDMVCAKLGIRRPCTTATTPLPGSEPEEGEAPRQDTSARKAAAMRMGSRIKELEGDSPEGAALVCECEEVSFEELSHAIHMLSQPTLGDLRRRVRLGMGPCQGCLCACRAEEALCNSPKTPDDNLADLGKFLSERWRGIAPICWDDALREAQYLHLEYSLSLGLDPSMLSTLDQPQTGQTL